MSNNNNPVGLQGIDFVEFSSPEPQKLHDLFLSFGFSRTMRHKNKKIDYYNQNDIHFFLNSEPDTFSAQFYKEHGPSISSMGWRVDNRELALKTAIDRGAVAGESDYSYKNEEFKTIKGIGDSLIYFVDDYKNTNRYLEMGFEALKEPDIVPNKGFSVIDHLTNNVQSGTMEKWANFYKDIFGFTEIRYFDIKGVKTGLLSYALQSPCKNFCIPINEGTEKKSQINEYLEEYKGAGIQHIAFLTDDIISSVDAVNQSSIETLNIDDEYYNEVFDRVPNVTESHKELQKRDILVDGDEEGYLLQIFTKNLIGPIFIEIIQRKNNHNFGEGNFGALFRSIEKDQEERGYLD